MDPRPNIILIAEIGSILITQLIELDDETAKQFMLGSLLKLAEERMVKNGWRVQQRAKESSDQAEFETQFHIDI